MSPVTRKLIAKEIFMNRWLVGGTVAAGLLSLLLACTSRMGFNVGALTWLTTLVAFGVILAMYSIVQERKDRALLFVLSLPLSMRDYVRAKLLGLLICYLFTWLVLGAAAVIVVLAMPGIPDGGLPFLVLLLVFMLANFSVVLAAMLLWQSEVVINVTVIVTNMAITLFMFGVGATPGIYAHIWHSSPTWNDTFWTALVIELAVLAAMLAAPLLVPDRKHKLL